MCSYVIADGLPLRKSPCKVSVCSAHFDPWCLESQKWRTRWIHIDWLSDVLWMNSVDVCVVRSYVRISYGRVQGLHGDGSVDPLAIWIWIWRIGPLSDKSGRVVYGRWFVLCVLLVSNYSLYRSTSYRAYDKDKGHANHNVRWLGRYLLRVCSCAQSVLSYIICTRIHPCDVSCEVFLGVVQGLLDYGVTWNTIVRKAFVSSRRFVLGLLKFCSAWKFVRTDHFLALLSFSVAKSSILGIKHKVTFGSVLVILANLLRARCKLLPMLPKPTSIGIQIIIPLPPQRRFSVFRSFLLYQSCLLFTRTRICLCTFFIILDGMFVFLRRYGAYWVVLISSFFSTGCKFDRFCSSPTPPPNPLRDNFPFWPSRICKSTEYS